MKVASVIRSVPGTEARCAYCGNREISNYSCTHFSGVYLGAKRSRDSQVWRNGHCPDTYIVCDHWKRNMNVISTISRQWSHNYAVLDIVLADRDGGEERRHDTQNE